MALTKVLFWNMYLSIPSLAGLYWFLLEFIYSFLFLLVSQTFYLFPFSKLYPVSQLDFLHFHIPQFHILSNVILFNPPCTPFHRQSIQRSSFLFPSHVSNFFKHPFRLFTDIITSSLLPFFFTLVPLPPPLLC